MHSNVTSSLNETAMTEAKFRQYSTQELLNPKILLYFNCFSYFMLILDVACTLCYGKLVFRCTSKEMKTFRYLTIFYLFSTIAIEILLFLWKPIALLPFQVIYPMGPLSPMTAKTSLCFLLLTTFFMSLLLETLLLILFEKYFVILIFTQPKFKYYRIPIYVFIYTVYLIFLATIVFIAFQIIPDDREAQKLLRENVVDAEEVLLRKQPSLLMKPQWSLSFITALIIFAGYCGSRLLAGTWLIYANFKYIKLSSASWSKRTHKQMLLIFRSTVAQLAVNFSLAFVPCISWFITTLFSLGDEHAILLFLICFAFTLSYPAVDFLAVIFVIEPYKQTVLKCIKDLLNLHRIQLFPDSNVFVAYRS